MKFKAISRLFCLVFFWSIYFDAQAQTTIWSDDFESYADNTITAADNNTGNPDLDWSIEPGSSSFFRVESDGALVITGTKGMASRNTGQGISKSWQSELIDITGFSNISVSLNIGESGTQELDDGILAEYRLDGGPWFELINGNHFDDLSGIELATATGLFGCTIEIRVTIFSDSNYDYWFFDDVLVQGITETSNSCLESTSVSLTETASGATSDYTFTQTIGSDAGLDLTISSGNEVTIELAEGDLSTADASTSTFDGNVIGSFTSQSSTSISFNAPSSVSEGSSFDVVIAGVTNTVDEGSYNSSLRANNAEGGINHSNYEYTIGPDAIWYEDFESYADNTTIAVDNNTDNPGLDWEIEPGAASYFRVENSYLIDGSRTMNTRNTGPGISKSWQSEVIDISAYDNVKLSVDYMEFGDQEPDDGIVLEYSLDSGPWLELTNGNHFDDMSSPQTATVTGLLGCSVEVRVTIFTDSNYDYWSFDNVLVASESAASNSCLESTSMSLTETASGATSDYTFTQTIGSDAGLDLTISSGNEVTIELAEGDLSTADASTSTFDGNVIGSFTSQSSTSISFNAPSSVSEGSSFDVVITGVTNTVDEGSYNSSLRANNAEGGINHSNYEYTIGPDAIWYEDFESYADNTTIAVDNNTDNPGLDWEIEPGAASYFRVENSYLIDGSRTMNTRNTGPGISKSWQSEVIDISAYDNVKLSVDYMEFGDQEPDDGIVLEYSLDSGPWLELTNGNHFDDMSSPQTATVTGLLGCSVEVRVTIFTDSNYDYWSFDNVLVASESAASNSCLESTSMSLTETASGATSDYTFTQTIGSDAGLDLTISSGNEVTIELAEGDLSTADASTSTFDGNVIGSFTSQSSTSISFNAPSSVSEGSSFDVVIAGVTNTVDEGSYNSSLRANNAEGGINHSNYEYTIGPDAIWYEDFESYADNTTIAVDNNTDNPGLDWEIEPGAASYFRVENSYLIDGSRTMNTRNTGPGISKSWQSEVIDISAYDNVKLSVDYMEFGDQEPDDGIVLEYSLDSGPWLELTNGNHFDDMSSPQTATVTGLLGCSVEVRVTIFTDSNYDYWSFDNVLVASESAASNSCLESTSMSLTETASGATSDYTFTQTIGSDAGLDLTISSGNEVTIELAEGDLSTADASTSTFDGNVIGSFTSQSSTSISFNAPSSVSEGSSFDVVITGVTNTVDEGSYNSSLRANNAEGGINHSNYEYTIGPDAIWYEDFESYADNTTIAVDNNTDNPGLDWEIEPGAASYFRVENSYLIDGSRTMNTRNTGPGISKSWQSEVIDISAYDNVKLSVDYMEFGDQEPDDGIVLEYSLDSGPWLELTNGNHFDDMSSPQTATVTGLLGCSVEVRVTIFTDSNYDYWSFDNVLVASESAASNSCLESTSMSLTETASGATSDYTFTQTIGSDAGLDLTISSGNEVTIELAEGDLSTADASTSTFDGNVIGSFTSQSSTSISFNAPSSVSEGSSFDVVIAGVTNTVDEGSYNSSLRANNAEGGINHSNYEYTIGPDAIWYEDFESYADNTTIAVDNNTDNPGLDWEIEPGAASYFRVENSYLIDGSRTMNTRNTGPGISKSWQSEVIDISAYDNVKLSVDYMEFGDQEPDDGIVLEYSLDSGPWLELTNGNHFDDMSSPQTATVTGLLGCSVEVRVTIFTDSNYDYWSFDNVLVASESAASNSCLESTSMSLTETASGATSDYTFTQTIGSDAGLDLTISSGNEVTIELAEGDLSTADASTSTFDGNVIGSFTSQSSTSISFNAPSSVSEGSSFDVVIAGVTNTVDEGSYNSSLRANNAEGGINHSNYEYTIGPDAIWYEDFESYADNTTIAVDNNTDNPGLDWEIEPGAASYFRVENSYLIDGSRTMNTRNTGPGISKSWQSEVIDISAYDNVKLSVDYMEFGDQEPDDYIDVDYRIDGSAWMDFTINGYHSDDMASPQVATATGLLGCTVEIRVTIGTDSNYDYWSFDNVLVASEFSTGNSCFESAVLTLSDDAPNTTSDYTFSQEIAMNGTFDLGLSEGASVSIEVPVGDLSTATPSGSTFNGQSIPSFTSQTANQITFEVPISGAVDEGEAFDIVIANITNSGISEIHSGRVEAYNNSGGLNFHNYQFSISPTTVYARVDGQWGESDTWSVTGVGENKCDCLPGTTSNVIIDGYDVILSLESSSIFSLLVQNDTRDDDASLSVSNGVTLDVAASIMMEIDDPAENTSLLIDGIGTIINVGNDLVMTTVSGSDLTLDLSNNASLDIAGDLLANHNGGDDLIVDIDGSSQVDVDGDVNIVLSGGDDLIFQAGTSVITIDGDLYVDHNGNTGGDDLILTMGNNFVGTIGGSLHIDSDFTSNDLLIMRLNNSAELTINGDTEFTAVMDGKSELELNDDAELILLGNFIRNAGYGILDANDNSTVQFAGNGGGQVLARMSGTGSDNFTYANVNINNSFGIGPQITLDGDVTMTGVLMLNDGIISTGVNTLICSGTSATGIQNYSSSSFIHGNLRKSIASNSNVYPLPMGTGNTSGDYHLAEFINNNLTGVSALNVSATIISETGNNVDANLDPDLAEDGAIIVNIFEDVEWDISPVGTASGGSYGINLYVANISGLDASLDNAFTVLKRPSASTDYADWDSFSGSTDIPVIDNSGRIFDSGNGFAQRTGFTSFSKFAIGASDGSFLPIELLSFTAKVEKGEVYLRWETATEINNDYFTIEKSLDGDIFEEVQQINGAGNSDKTLEYHWIDRNPILERLFYRLKQTDFDGKFTYSNIITVDVINAGETRIDIYPNPTANHVRVQLTKPEIGTFMLYSLDGYLLKQGKVSRDFEIDLVDQIPGIYLLYLEMDSRQIQRKIIKE